jgi:hypothetical protein
MGNAHPHFGIDPRKPRASSHAWLSRPRRQRVVQQSALISDTLYILEEIGVVRLTH